VKEIIGERVIKEVLNKVDPVVDAMELDQLLSEDDSDPFMHMRAGIEVGAQSGSHKEVEGTFTSWNKDLVKSNQHFLQPFPSPAEKCLAQHLQQVQHASPHFCCCGEAVQLRVGYVEGKEVIPYRRQL
jgi:hypothetical protein